MLPTIHRFLLLACGSLLALQVHAAPADDAPYTVPRSMVETVTSKSAQHYRIMVSWPEGKAPASGWPVMYVLDGSHYFAMATDMLRNQVCAYPCPLEAGVIVAIGYPDRSRREYDFTPKAPPGPPEMRLDGTPYPVVEYGGADPFLDFIESDLKPRIERRFQIDRTRQTLFGHSFGGLFVLHTLYTRPQAFSTYVASSPSIWWNNRFIEKEEQAFARRVNATALPRETRLLIGVGEGEQTLLQRELRGSATETGNLEWRRGRRRMVDSTRELAERLEELSSRNLVAMHRTFDNESHVSVPSVALATAVSMAFGIRPAEAK